MGNYTSKRGKDQNWTPCDERGIAETWEQVQVALLMDIRDELKRMNSVLNCPNALAIPFKLDRIVKNTTKAKRRKK